MRASPLIRSPASGRRTPSPLLDASTILPLASRSPYSTWQDTKIFRLCWYRRSSPMLATVPGFPHLIVGCVSLVGSNCIVFCDARLVRLEVESRRAYDKVLHTLLPFKSLGRQGREGGRISRGEREKGSSSVFERGEGSTWFCRSRSQPRLDPWLNTSSITSRIFFSTKSVVISASAKLPRDPANSLLF